MSGNALADAARKVKEKALGIAAEALEANPDDLEIVDGVVSVKGTPSKAIPLTQVAVLANPLRYSFSEAARAATQFAGTGSMDEPPVKPGEEPGLEATGWYSPVHATFASGAHAVELEIDPDTSEVEIIRYCVVHDCGRMINPMIVEGQIHGGVAQGSPGRSMSAWPTTRRQPPERIVHGLSHAVLHRDPDGGDRPSRDAEPAQPARHQGGRRGRRDPNLGRHRLGHRRRRGLRGQPNAARSPRDPRHAGEQQVSHPATRQPALNGGRRPGPSAMLGCDRIARARSTSP